MQAPQLRREHSYFLPNNALQPQEKELLMEYYKDEVQKMINASPYKSLNNVPKNSALRKKMEELLETVDKYGYLAPVAYADIPESDRRMIEVLQINLEKFIMRTEHPEEDPDVIQTLTELKALYKKYGISMSNSNNDSRPNRRSRKTRRGKKRRNTRNTRNA